MADSVHIVSSYEEELSLLDQKIAQMGGLAEHLMAQSFDALSLRNEQLAESVIHQDEQLDQMERQVESQAIEMIARRQPMAVDLRQIMTAIRISSDLERIGDLSKNLAKRALAVQAEQRPENLMAGLRHMMDLALAQLKDVLDAYGERDAALAVEVWRRDQDIDRMYNSLFREMLTYMMEDPRNIGLCTHLLFGAKNIERIGDHTTNIAENIYFLIKGVNMRSERPKEDATSKMIFSAPRAG